jgi:NAD(P)-dependent dehydrogenase (short-subunit alcohol dehydrogenase family)
VTGSDSGIGKATVVALTIAGMDIGITWHEDEAGAEATAEEVRSHGRKAIVAHLDTTNVPTCGTSLTCSAALVCSSTTPEQRISGRRLMI